MSSERSAIQCQHFSESNDDQLRHQIALTLRDGLMAFVVLQPRIGYVQGMNDLYGRFLQVFDGDVVSFAGMK